MSAKGMTARQISDIMEDMRKELCYDCLPRKEQQKSFPVMLYFTDAKGKIPGKICRMEAIPAEYRIIGK